MPNKSQLPTLLNGDEFVVKEYARSFDNWELNFVVYTNATPKQV